MADERTRTTGRAAVWIAVLLVVGALGGLWMLGTPADTQHSTSTGGNVPAWAQLSDERYPCPTGERRTYVQLSPGVWRANCIKD